VITNHRFSVRKAVSLMQAGDYFVALCDDGTLWQVSILETDAGRNAEWERCTKAIPGCLPEAA
jgi:hypothetical protein